ncbi:MAG: alpha/beta hydrolase, partial [Acidimicrobiales bacterium]
RTGPAVRAGLLAVLGVVGLTAGAAVGLLHLVKSDLGPPAFAGLLALTGGLVLLVVGSVALVRATPGWWRLVLVPVALVVLQFVVLPVTIAVYATNPPATRVGAQTPVDRGLAYEDVTFATSDHVPLSAWYLPSTNGAGVVLLHGSGSTRSAVLDEAAVLAGAGYGVLAVDARGHGGSGGDAMDLGWWGDRDVSAAVIWLESRPDVVDGRVAAVGLSMGGEEAVGAAASDPRMRAVVAEGALGRGSMDDSWLAHDVQGLIERGTLAVQTEVADLLTSAPRPGSLQSALVAIAPRPVLLIAGRDELRGDRAYAAAAPAVELWELPDTAHVAGLATHPDEWTRRVTGFLDTALAGP